MSFGIIYNDIGLDPLGHKRLYTQLLLSISQSIDLSKFDLENLYLGFDIEHPNDLPIHINKRKINRLLKLYNKDSMEFLNTILWEFLLTNPETKSKLDLLDEIICLPEEHEAMKDALIKKASMFQSFASYARMMIKEHGIDFNEYAVFHKKKMRIFHHQQYNTSNITLVPLKYEYPTIKKISSSIFLEIHPLMDNKYITDYLYSVTKSNLAEFVKYLASSSKAKTLIDALLLYKYHKDIQIAHKKAKKEQILKIKKETGGYEEAKRKYNFHILQVYKVSTKMSKLPKAGKNCAKNKVCKIETGLNLELTEFRFNETKKAIRAIETLLHLPKIGT